MRKHDCPSCRCETREFIVINEHMSIEDKMKVQPALGRILSQDIGKRVYFVNGHPQVESNEQFNRRIKA